MLYRSQDSWQAQPLASQIWGRATGRPELASTISASTAPADACMGADAGAEAALQAVVVGCQACCCEGTDCIALSGLQQFADAGICQVVWLSGIACYKCHAGWRGWLHHMLNRGDACTCGPITASVAALQPLAKGWQGNSFCAEGKLCTTQHLTMSDGVAHGEHQALEMPSLHVRHMQPLGHAHCMRGSMICSIQICILKV